MMVSYQEQATVTKQKHAPVWVSVVSGLAGQAPLSREHARKRLALLLILATASVSVIGLALALNQTLH
jgi:hypothetical protein